jgi:hypothetical protein
VLPVYGTNEIFAWNPLRANDTSVLNSRRRELPRVRKVRPCRLSPQYGPPSKAESVELKIKSGHQNKSVEDGLYLGNRFVFLCFSSEIQSIYRKIKVIFNCLLFWQFWQALFGATLSRRIYNTSKRLYNTNDLIKAIGVRIYFLRPFPIILDSIQSKIQQKLFLIIQMIKTKMIQTKWRWQCMVCKYGKEKIRTASVSAV